MLSSKEQEPSRIMTRQDFIEYLSALKMPNLVRLGGVTCILSMPERSEVITSEELYVTNGDWEFPLSGLGIKDNPFENSSYASDQFFTSMLFVQMLGYCNLEAKKLLNKRLELEIKTRLNGVLSVAGTLAKLHQHVNGSDVTSYASMDMINVTCKLDPLFLIPFLDTGHVTIPSQRTDLRH